MTRAVINESSYCTTVANINNILKATCVYWIKHLTASQHCVYFAICNSQNIRRGYGTLLYYFNLLVGGLLEVAVFGHLLKKMEFLMLF